MKLYSKLALFIACALAFAACSSDDDFKAGEWDGRANDAQVYFAADSISFSEILDPSAPTTKVFTIHRKDSVGALTVKLTAVENTDSLFKVSDAVFADGKKDATFTINFDGAEPDKNYKLLLKAEGYNSSYSSESVLFAYSMLIEKWNELGVGLYTDDTVASIFTSVTPVDFEVTILEKASKPGMYRIVYPYGESYPYNEPGDWDDSKDYNIDIDASDPKAVVIPAQPLGIDYGYGMIWMRSYEKGTLEDGIITFPQNGMDGAMADYRGGDWVFYGNSNGAFRVVLPEKYATMQEEE